MDAAPELFVGKQREPAFDQVEPAGRSGRKVQMKPRSFRQPVADQLRLVGAVVVQDQMDIQVRRNVFFNGIEEVTKLDRAMASLCLSDQLARLGVERGKETGGAVTRIIVSAAFNLPWPHGQQRRGSIQRLYLRLLVHT